MPSSSVSNTYPAHSYGRHRWVVEHTLAWLARYRRLTISYERTAALH